MFKQLMVEISSHYHDCLVLWSCVFETQKLLVYFWPKHNPTLRKFPIQLVWITIGGKTIGLFWFVTIGLSVQESRVS